MLLVDGVPQSHVDLDDPSYLDFEYVRRLGHVIDTAAPAAQPLRVLHLGAGALTLARYVTATRPSSTQLAVEVDAALVDLVRRRLPLRGVRVRIGDARAVLERLRAGSFDVVIADVFAGNTARRRGLWRQRGRRGAAGPRPGAGGDVARSLSAGGAHR
jgi:spermidine synthase